MARLGGSSFVITPGQGTWQLETRLGVVMDGAAAEHVREGIPVLASYCDALGIRAFAAGQDLAHDLAETDFNALAALVDKPLINLESAANHPCQALADWKTLDDFGIAAARPLRALLGLPSQARCRWPCRPRRCIWRRCAAWKSSYCGPTALRCRPQIMHKARRAAAQSGGSVRETSDRRDALAGAQVIYAKEWARDRLLWRSPAGCAACAARSRTGACSRTGLRSTAADCRLMHCLPVRRNTAVADEVLDSPRSIVQREAFNRLAVQMAVLHRMLKGV